MSNAMLQATRELTRLSNELAEKIDLDHLAILEKYLQPKQNTWYETRSAPAQIAEAIIKDFIVSNNYATDVSGELVRLARKTDLDAGPILERMVNEKAWLQVAIAYELQDMTIASWIFKRFCEKPDKEIARIIISHSWLPQYLDLERSTLAGIDAKAFTKSLLRVLPKPAAATYIQHVLVPESPHFINGLEIFLTVATPADELEILKTVAQFMQRRWSDWEAEPHYYYEATDRRKLIEKDYSRCRTLLASNPCTKRSSQILERFAVLASTPFHEYRTLIRTVESLAELLSSSTLFDLDLVRLALQIIPPRKIHPAALRYLLRQSSTTIRSKLGQIIRTSPIVITGSFENEPSVNSAPLFDPDGRLAEAYDPQCRIWPKNQAIVSLMFTPIENSRENFSRVATKEWNRDEDALSERLVMSLFQELDTFSKSQELREWISNRYRYGRLAISEPFIRDRESSWGADIGLVVNYDVEDTMHHQWCYLLQAKKAQGPITQPTRWDIDREQLNDLLLITSAGFYLLYSPLVDKASPFVVPARTILSILEAVEAGRRSPGSKIAKSIPYFAGRDLGKSWGSFMLEDVMGAWSGDIDKTLIEQMQANGTLARVVFNVQIALGRQVG